MVWAYVDGGADDLHTLADNRAAFDRWTLRPAVLAGVTEPDLTTTVAGVALRAPILLAPCGLTGLSYWKGDLAAARAAVRGGTRYVLSTASSWSIEEVFAHSPDGHFFQLYPRSGDIAAALMARAWSAGCRVAFETVDVPLLGNREAERRSGMGHPPILSPARAVDFARHPGWTYRVVRHGRIGARNLVSASGLGAALASVEVQSRQFMQSSMTWDDVAWIRDQWPGKLYLKGILRAEDAVRAAALGMDGVVVSNHGGRQLDRSIASLDALPDVVGAVGGRVEVLLDGGIRRGTDIVTALALGADAVLIGRPYVYGLAAAGQRGVEAVLDILYGELRRAMILLGAPNV